MPTRPYRPYPPHKPTKKIPQRKIVSTIDQNRVKPMTIMEIVCELENMDIPNPMDIFVIPDTKYPYGDDTGEGVVNLTLIQEIDNPDYEQQIERYKERYKKYKEDKAKYDIDYKKYLEHMKQYKIYHAQKHVLRAERNLKKLTKDKSTQ